MLSLYWGKYILQMATSDTHPYRKHCTAVCYQSCHTLRVSCALLCEQADFLLSNNTFKRLPKIAVLFKCLLFSHLFLPKPPRLEI